MTLLDTYSETAPHAEPLESAPSRFRVWVRWPLRIFLLGFCLWIAAAGISFWIQHDSSLQNNLTTRLAAAFGRPVEVGGYNFSLWDGPVLEAQSVTVAEDPRFGREYFLRAESMTLRLRWQSLLRGRIELGALSLTRPSLNVVRNSAGEWNLTEWLPRPGIASPPNAMPGPSRPATIALRFDRIQVTGGRINFKRDDEKLSEAFVGVTGTIDADTPGRWKMDLEASPWRAAIILQQAGTIHLSGHVGGISSRLRPAVLDASWTEASISDVLRLGYGDDYGIRGTVSLLMNASTRDQDDSWAIQSRAELRQIHRWDLAARPDNPSVNLISRMLWRPAGSTVEVTDLALESPASHAHANASISWNGGESRKRQATIPVAVTIDSAILDAGDLLAWLRAFHSGIAGDVSVHGLAGGHARFSAWPLRLVDASALTQGLTLTVGGLPWPIDMGPAQFLYDRGSVSFRPLALSWGPPSVPDGSFRLDVPAKPALKGFPSWHISGSTRQMRDLIVMTGAFGLSISRGWNLSGPLSCDLRWPGARYPWQLQPIGRIDFGAPAPDPSAELAASFLNMPITQLRAHADLKPGAQHIALSSAQAFGTGWAGTFDRRDTNEGWQFTLSGDHLAVEDLDRWLNPRWRESFLGRMLPFLNTGASSSTAPENLRVSGRLSLDQLSVAPFTVRRFQGDLKISGRRIDLAGATGQFYGGAITGSLNVDAQVLPVYHANLDFSRVDLSALTVGTPKLAGLFEGLASGKLSLNAGGGSRAAIISSLECQGMSRVANARLHGLDLVESLRAAATRSGVSSFSGVTAAFTCGKGSIRLEDVVLASPAGAITGSGSVDLARSIEFQLQAAPTMPPTSSAGNASAAVEGAYRLTGTLNAPQIIPVSPTLRRPR